MTWIFPLPLFSPQSWSTGPLCTDPLRGASADAYQLVSATPQGVATLSSPFWSAVVYYCGSSKYEVRCVQGQDDVNHIRQDSMKWITYNKSVSMVITWVRLEGGFSCVAEEHVSMFVVRNGLKNMIHQMSDTGEHMIGCRCLTYMDVVRSAITEYVCQDSCISCRFLGKPFVWARNFIMWYLTYLWKWTMKIDDLQWFTC